jgi:PAS domain S-box-containing protein
VVFKSESKTPLGLILIFLLLTAGIGMAGYVYFDRQRGHILAGQAIHGVALLTSVLVGCLILGAGVSAGLIWRHQRSRYYRAQYRAELERNAIAQRYEHLTRAANDIILTLDQNLKIIEVNDRALESYGYLKEEILGLHAKQLRPPGTRSLFEEQFTRSVAEQGGLLQTIHQRKNGPPFPVEISSRPISIEGEIFYLSIVRDVTERNEIEMALKESERFASGAIDALSSSICILDENGGIIRVNQRWKEFALENPPIPEDCFVGTNYLTVCETATGQGSEGALEFAAGIRAVMGGGCEEFAREYPCHSPTQQRYFIGRVTRFRGDGPVRIVIVHEDVTYRRLFADALRESEARYRLLAENVRDVVWRLDLQTNRIIYVSPSIQGLCGYTREEILSRPFEASLTPESYRNVQEWLAASLSEHAAGRAGSDQPLRQVEQRCKDGTTVWTEVAVSLLFDEENQPLEIVGVSRDISERKRAEDALRQNDRRLAEAQRIARMGYWERDLRTDKILWSDETFRIFGLQPGDREIDRPVMLELIHPDDRSLVSEAPEKALRNDHRYEIEYRVVRPDGAERILHSQGEVALDDAGRPLRAFGILLDITERRLAEQRVLAALAEKEVLIKEIHHRVKNNLQVISSLLNLQVLRLHDEKTREILKESQNRIRSMALVHEKLYQSDDLGRIDMASYIRELTSHLLHTYRTSPALVEATIEVERVFLNLTTAIPLGLLLNELVTNAMKHAFPGGRKGRIRVALGMEKDGSCTFLFRDNGVGFSDTSSQEVSLGLTLIDLLAKQLGGTLERKTEGGAEYRIMFKEIQRIVKEISNA